MRDTVTLPNTRNIERGDVLQLSDGALVRVVSVDSRTRLTVRPHSRYMRIVHYLTCLGAVILGVLLALWLHAL